MAFADTRIRLVTPDRSRMDEDERGRAITAYWHRVSVLRRLRTGARGASVEALQEALDALHTTTSAAPLTHIPHQLIAGRARRVAREADKLKVERELREREAQWVEAGYARWVEPVSVVRE